MGSALRYLGAEYHRQFQTRHDKWNSISSATSNVKENEKHFKQLGDAWDYSNLLIHMPEQRRACQWQSYVESFDSNRVMLFIIFLELFRIVLIAFLTRITSAGVEQNLRIVHVIWRHGARAPLQLFPHDSLSKASKWPNGLGELTSEGMRQQLLLGKLLRERYKGFISNYTAKSVYVRSTDTNRTIVSALVNLHGMFPSKGIDAPLNVSWQPIPVHTVPRRFDKILEVTYSYCPYPDSIFFNEVMTSEPVKKIMEENAELFNFLRNQTGLTIPTFTDIYDVYDPLNCERFHYKESSAPHWVSEELFRKIESLFKISTLYYYSHPIIRRFRGEAVNFYLLISGVIAFVSGDKSFYGSAEKESSFMAQYVCTAYS
ncbi:histidine acid phosphatase [Trichuris suis]|nr:histidine acid phosphatase [Trichuris suis]